jgi:hypothetical protein
VNRPLLGPRARRAATAAVVALVAPLCLLVTAGCGESGPEMARVRGKVTYTGQPVPKGTITFQAATPGGRNATGAIVEDGSYELQTENPGDGAIVGEYRVAITARDDAILDYIPKKAPPPKRLTPEKYEDPASSGLTATVKSGSNSIDFPLVD